MQVLRSVAGAKEPLPVTSCKFRPDMEASPMQNILLVTVVSYDSLCEGGCSSTPSPAPDTRTMCRWV